MQRIWNKYSLCAHRHSHATTAHVDIESEWSSSVIGVHWKINGHLCTAAVLALCFTDERFAKCAPFEPAALFFFLCPPFSIGEYGPTHVCDFPFFFSHRVSGGKYISPADFTKLVNIFVQNDYGCVVECRYVFILCSRSLVCGRLDAAWIHPKMNEKRNKHQNIAMAWGAMRWDGVAAVATTTTPATTTATATSTLEPRARSYRSI